MSYNAPGPVKATYRFECAVCGEVVEQHEELRFGMSVLGPEMPDNWNYYSGFLNCGKHEIKGDLIIDGKRGEFLYPSGRWRSYE